MKLYTLRPWLFQRGKFDRYSAAEKRDMLKSRDICIVVNMTARVDADMEKLCTYYCCPIPDSKAADMVLVERYVNAVVGLVKGGCVVLVHCNGGRNRSSLFSARLLMEVEGLTGRAAVKELRRLRPNALSNEFFVKYLEGL